MKMNTTKTTTTTTTSTTAASSSSTVLIQRIIILHRGLLLQSNDEGGGNSGDGGGGDMDESASLEELSEHILYFYDRSIHGQRQYCHLGPNKSHMTDECTTYLQNEEQENNAEDNSSLAATRITSQSHPTSASFSDISSPSDVPVMTFPMDHITEEAVKFAGLCQALHDLPLSFADDTDGDDDANACQNGSVGQEFETGDLKPSDRTREVHLSHSTLIFVPLEEEEEVKTIYNRGRKDQRKIGNILAIVQVPRAKRGSSSSTLGSESVSFPGVNNSIGVLPGQGQGGMAVGGDPLAVRTSIQQCHELFKMIRGGGIHHRLLFSATDIDEELEKNRGEESSVHNPMAKNVEAKWSTAKKGEGNDCSSVSVVDGVIDEEGEKSSFCQHKKDTESGTLLSSEQESVMATQTMDHTHKSVAKNGPKSMYPGMAQLYSLRKKLRKLTKQLNRCRIEYAAHNADGEQPSDSMDVILQRLEFQTEETQDEIYQLLAMLPVNALRLDLIAHYDEYIADIGEKCDATGGGIGRCIVELVPAPPPTSASWSLSSQPPAASSSSFFAQSPPTLPSVHAAAALGRIIRNLLANTGSDDAVIGGTAPRLAGVSSFYSGRLLYTHMANDCIVYDNAGANQNQSSKMEGSDDIIVTPQTSCSLLRHFTSFRLKVSRASTVYPPSGSLAQTGNPLFLPSRSNSSLEGTANHMPSASGNGSSAIDENSSSSSSTNATSVTSSQCLEKVKGEFIPPPPLSILNISEKVHCVSVPSIGLVWVPLVYLSRKLSSGNGCGRTTCMVPTHIAIYEWECFSFILFMVDGGQQFSDERMNMVKKEQARQETYRDNQHANFSALDRIAENGEEADLHNSTGQKSPPFIEELESSTLSSLLQSASAQLTLEFAKLRQHVRKDVLEQNETFSSHLSNLCDGNRAVIYWGEPGLEIVFVDRLENYLVLLSQSNMTTVGIGRDNSSGVETTKAVSSMKKKKFPKAFRGKKSTLNGQNKSTANDNSSLHPLPVSLDCRHLLASHLPLDVVLAFDDMFNEIRRISGTQSSLESTVSVPLHVANSDLRLSDARVIELCTFLPQGWMYTRAHGQRELYILFDTSMYITIADVQKAAIRVRKELFNDVFL